MSMRESTLIQKADLALSDITTDGGLLQEEQSNTFIRTLIEQPTLLKEARVIPMSSPKMEVNKIKFGSRILQAASQDTAASSSIHSGRYLTESARSKPSTSKVLLDVKEIMAEVRLPYEVVEDNIERDNFSNTLLALIAGAAARDIEELIIQGDTSIGSSDPYLDLLDGVLVQATSNVVDALGDPMDANVATSVQKAMPKQFRALPGMKYYVTSNAEVDVRLAIASRNTGLGDAMLTGQQPIMLHGKPLQGIHKMPDSKGFYTDPRNVVVGFHRQVRVEMDKDIRSRELIFVLTARLDVKLEEETAVVKITNLAA